MKKELGIIPIILGALGLFYVFVMEVTVYGDFHSGPNPYDLGKLNMRTNLTIISCVLLLMGIMIWLCGKGDKE
jgi:hypothetical protein